MLVSGPAEVGVGWGKAAQILTWSYSTVFLSPMPTAIRTSVFSFAGALSVLFIYPTDTESAQLIVWISSAACTAGGRVLGLLP